MKNNARDVDVSWNKAMKRIVKNVLKRCIKNNEKGDKKTVEHKFTALDLRNAIFSNTGKKVVDAKVLKVEEVQNENIV